MIMMELVFLNVMMLLVWILTQIYVCAGHNFVMAEQRPCFAMLNKIHVMQFPHAVQHLFWVSIRACVLVETLHVQVIVNVI